MDTHVGFSTSTSPVSAVIRTLTRSRASHAWFLYRDTDLGLDMVLEAVGSGLRLIPFEVWRHHNRVVATVPLGRSLNQGLAHAVMWIGTRYDGGGLFGMAVVMVGRWFRRTWRNPWASSRALFCSEVVVRALQRDGFPGAERLDPEGTSPADLMAFLGAR